MSCGELESTTRCQKTEFRRHGEKLSRMLTQLAEELTPLRRCCGEEMEGFKNVVFERHQLWSHQRTAGTSVDIFITELRQRSKDCEFGTSENDMLRDKLVFSITDCELKERLLQERGLTLHTAIEICRATEQAKTPFQAMETEDGLEGVPVEAEMKRILPAQSLHHNSRKHFSHQCVQNVEETGKLLLAAFTPKVQLHRFQLQQPSVPDCVFSERKNVEQLFPERVHIKEEPETLGEGQEGEQLWRQQETNSAACPVKCEDEEEKPQASRLHWRQQTHINIKEEPSSCTLEEFRKRQSVGMNSKGAEGERNPDPSRSELQGSDGAGTHSPLSDLREEEGEGEEEEEEEEEGEEEEGEGEEEEGEGEDGDCKSSQKPFSLWETSDFDSNGEGIQFSGSINNPETGCKASKAQMSLFEQISLNQEIVKTFKPVTSSSSCLSRRTVTLNKASHMIEYFEEKPFVCTQCGECFEYKSNLEIHSRMHSREKPFKCNVCTKSFTRKFNLNIHWRGHTGEKPFKCDFCSKGFTRKSNLNVHLRIHTGDKAVRCDVCCEFFREVSDLRRHMRVHMGEKHFECAVCTKTFTQKSDLNKHMRFHTGEKPFKCDVCTKGFTQKSDLNNHMRIHTGEKPYRCDICRKCFRQITVLNRHMRVHTGEKPFGCDICSKRFVQKSDLRTHERVHTGKKPFGCHVCSQSFCQKAHLHSHMRVHTGEKPFGCDACGKCFNRKSDLKNHRKVHTGEKPFGCNGFSQRFGLIRHLTIHSEEKPFGCDLLSKC